MITGKEAIKIFKEKNPELKIISAVDLDSNYYLVDARKDFTSVDFNGSTYAINKSNGEISSFSPLDYGIDKFAEANEKRGLIVDEN